MSDQNALPSTEILENIKNIPLVAIFICHFVLTTWGIQGYWSPDSYAFYSAFFFLTILWALHNKESQEPVLLCLVINALSIMFDVIVLCIFFPHGGRDEKFSGVMAIFNLLIRPISCISLYKHWRDRINGPPTDFNFAGTSSAKKSYQDVQSPSYQGVDSLTTPYQ